MAKKHELEGTIREELVLLWSDLAEAQRRAINTDWSMECIGLAERIVKLTKLVGPTDWEDVETPLLLNGIYQRLMDEAAIQVQVPLNEVRESWDRYLAEQHAGSGYG